MAKIGELIGRTNIETSPAHTSLPPGNIGLELELEGRGDWPDVNGWRKEADGSLRDGIEYVFNGPAGGATALRNIKNMARMLNANPVNNSFRCSTHIHLDVRDMDWEELRRFVIAYTMMEGVMFQHCSLDRRYSNFCTPYFLNTHLPRLFTGNMRDERDTHRLHHIGSWPKYTALNLKPLTSYGSVEFRGSHALITEAELLALAQRMLHLKRVALANVGTPLEFTEHIRNMALADIFPTGLAEGFMPDEKFMDQGYASAIGIATGNTARSRVPTAAGLTAAAGTARTRANDVAIEMDRTAMDRYNLFHRTFMSLSQVVNMVKNLRQVRGIEQPTLFTFVTNNNHGYDVFGGGNNLIRMLNEQGIAAREVGM